MNELNIEIIKYLADARATLQEHKVDWDYINDQFHKEHEFQFAEMEASALKVKVLEQRVRDLALVDHQHHETKEWFDKSVYIKTTTKLNYDPEDALRWAKKNNYTQLWETKEILIKPDTENAIKIFKPDFATFDKVVSVSIAKTLNIPETDIGPEGDEDERLARIELRSEYENDEYIANKDNKE